MKTMFSRMLIAGMMLAACAAVNAATEIGTAADFVEKLAADPAGDYVLTDDIDLTDAGFATIESFSGKLDGDGHTVRGLATSFAGSFSGMMSDITFDGTVDEANRVCDLSDNGLMCSTCYGGKFTDVVIAGYTLQHKGGTYENNRGVAFFAAQTYDGSEFVRCATAPGTRVEQKAVHRPQAGFVGKVSITTASGVIVRFEDCTNNASVAAIGNWGASLGTAGFVSYTDSKGSADIPEMQFIRCVNNGNITCTDGTGLLGGFVGIHSGNGSVSHTFHALFVGCENNGDVASASGSSMGGFIGYSSNSATATFRNCINRGAIGGESVACAAGFLASATHAASGSKIKAHRFESSANYGTITGKEVGGLACRFYLAGWFKPGYYEFYNCANYGELAYTVGCGALFARQEQEGATGTKLYIGNCWIAAAPIYSNCTHLASATNVHTNDQDVSGLNSVAAEDNFMPWVLGANSQPELACFATSCDESEIPVVFLDWDGEVLKREFVAKGADATPPANPSREGYVFKRWDKSYTAVSGITMVTAVYGANEYTITFDSDGGSACAPLTAESGAVITLPKPTRADYTFVCWTEDGAYREPSNMPDYDMYLKAVWKYNGIPKAVKLKVMQWSVVNRGEQGYSNFYARVAEELPDVVVSAYQRDWYYTSVDKMLPKGYAVVSRQTNGPNDGPFLMLAWTTNRFETVATKNVSGGSDDQELLAVLRLRGTDNHYAVHGYRASMNYCGDNPNTGFIGNIKSLMNGTFSYYYPTASILSCGDFTVATNKTDYATVSGGTAAGYADYFNSVCGTRTVAGGEDLQFCFERDAYEGLPIEVASTEVLEDDTVSTLPGRVTSFYLGKRLGFMMILR